MARAKKESQIESPATEETIQPDADLAISDTILVENEETIQPDDFTINDAILVENICNLRIIDKDGNILRFDKYLPGGQGVYWLIKA